MGCIEAPTCAALQRRTAPLISLWAEMYPTRRGRTAEVPTDQNLSARQGILSRYPWALPYQVRGQRAVPGGGGEGSDPARLRAPPAPQRPHPAPAPFLSPAAENGDVFQVFQSRLPCCRHTCSNPQSGTEHPARCQTYSPAVQESEEGPSRPGWGDKARWSGDV